MAFTKEKLLNRLSPESRAFYLRLYEKHGTPARRLMTRVKQDREIFNILFPLNKN